MKLIEQRIKERSEKINTLFSEIEKDLRIFNEELYVYHNMITGFGYTGQAIKQNTGNLEML